MNPSTQAIDTTVNDLDPAVLTFLQEGDYTVEEVNVVPHLKPWMHEAIGRREYTHDHVKILIHQKIGVWKAIRQDLDRGVDPNRSPFFSQPRDNPNFTRPTTADTQNSTAAGSSLFTRGDNTLPTSTTFSTQATRATTDPEIEQKAVELAYDWPALQRMWGGYHRGPPYANDPDPALPVAVQNVMRFDLLSTPPGADLLAEGYAFPQLSEDYRAREANALAEHQMGVCESVFCQQCRPVAPDRMPLIDAVMRGPMPPMHELLVSSLRLLFSYFSNQDYRTVLSLMLALSLVLVFAQPYKSTLLLSKSQLLLLLLLKIANTSLVSTRSAPPSQKKKRRR